MPIGWESFPEIPAGMLDGSGHFSGVAAKEMQVRKATGMPAGYTYIRGSSCVC